MNKELKIGAYVMVHNMAPLIPACINSLGWVDSIFIYDDHSTDGSLEIALKYAKCQIFYEKSTSNTLAFEEGEMRVRNMLIDKAFEILNVDILIILDADEMISKKIRPVILQEFSNSEIDSLCFSTWHLYDESRYLHFWETSINGVDLIDPHTRIIRKGRRFVPLSEDGSHPIIEATSKTFCTNGLYHFHLKYFHFSNLPNYSLFFLPERLTEEAVSPYLKSIPSTLPNDIEYSLSLIDWDTMPYYEETPHYKSERSLPNDPSEALIHPKDIKHL